MAGVNPPNVCGQSTRLLAVSRFEGSVVIARPPEEVWSYVADLARTPEWRTTVQTVEPPEELEVGAEFGATTRVLGRQWRWTLVLDAVEPPTTLSYSVAQGFTDLTVTYRLAPVEGGCRFSLVAESAADRAIERLLEPIAGRVLRRQTSRHLENLKAALDA